MIRSNWHNGNQINLKNGYSTHENPNNKQLDLNLLLRNTLKIIAFGRIMLWKYLFEKTPLKLINLLEISSQATYEGFAQSKFDL